MSSSCQVSLYILKADYGTEKFMLKQAQVTKRHFVIEFHCINNLDRHKTHYNNRHAHPV